MRIRLTKVSVREAVSFPGAIDIVFYRDEKGALYRLRYTDRGIPSLTFIESLHRVMCLSKYAPEIIDGEIVMDDPDEINVKMDKDIYNLKKNAENFEFIDADDFEIKTFNGLIRKETNQLKFM